MNPPAYLTLREHENYVEHVDARVANIERGLERLRDAVHSHDKSIRACDNFLVRAEHEIKRLSEDIKDTQGKINEMCRTLEPFSDAMNSIRSLVAIAHFFGKFSWIFYVGVAVALGQPMKDLLMFLVQIWSSK